MFDGGWFWTAAWLEIPRPPAVPFAWLLP